MLMGYVMLMVSVWLLKILSSYRVKKGDNLVEKKSFIKKGLVICFQMFHLNQI